MMAFEQRPVFVPCIAFMHKLQGFKYSETCVYVLSFIL